MNTVLKIFLIFGQKSVIIKVLPVCRTTRMGGIIMISPEMKRFTMLLMKATEYTGVSEGQAAEERMEILEFAAENLDLVQIFFDQVDDEWTAKAEKELAFYIEKRIHKRRSRKEVHPSITPMIWSNGTVAVIKVIM